MRRAVTWLAVWTSFLVLMACDDQAQASAQRAFLAESNEAYFARSEVPEAAFSVAAPESPIAGRKRATQPKQRIVTSQIALLIQDSTAFDERVQAIVKGAGGWVDSSGTGNHGASRSGTWVLRIPAEHHRQVKAALEELGDVEWQSVETVEVGDQLLDLQARLTSQRALEKRILALLERRGMEADSLADVLKIENELARVRGIIERLDAQRAGLQHKVAYSTITVTASVDVQVLRKEIAATFGDRAGTTWSISWQRLNQTIQSLALGAIALVPWLPLIVAFFFILRRLFRRRPRPPRRSRAAAPPAT